MAGGQARRDGATRPDHDDRPGQRAGLVPLALQAGEPGSEIQAPMAIVILFGLVSSTALNMIVVPALYLRFGDIAVRDKQAGS